MTKRHPVHWAWVILGVCFVNNFIGFAVCLGYSLVLPEMIRTLGFSRTAGGSIFNSYLLTYIILSPLVGYLTDRFGARYVITICSLIMGLGIFLLGTVQTFLTACLCFGIAGVGASGMWSPVISLTQRWFATHRRGLALGILSTGSGLSLAIMGAIFPWILHHFTWRHTWYFIGLLALLMVAVNSILLKSTPESSGYEPWGKGESSQNIDVATVTPAKTVHFIALFKDRNFWFIGLSYFAIIYSLFGFTTFMVDYAKYQLVVPMEKASKLAAIHGVCQILGVLTVLPLSDYLDRKKTIILANATITVSLAGILVAGNSWELLCVLVGSLAIFYSVSFPIYSACAGDYFQPELMGTTIGSWSIFYGLGAITTHWVTGILRDTKGVYDQAFLLNALMAAVGFILILLVQKNRSEQVTRG